MSSITKQCGQCQQIVRHDKYHQHMNLHTQPHELVPKTRPNTLKKIGLSKVIHADDTTDESDIAVRSILPSEVPQPEVERRDVSSPEFEGQLSKGGKDKNKVGKVGSNNGLEDGQGNNNKSGLMNNSGSPVNDQLDLNSNIVDVKVENFQDETLDIEKVIDLRPKKTVVTKKEIHKYQNTHNAARQTVDLGGCVKKLMANPLAQSRNVVAQPAEPVYEIKEVEKPFLSSLASTDPKNKATVSFSRKTAQSNPYNAIQTKSISGTNKKMPSDKPFGSNQYDSRYKDRGGVKGDSESEKGSNKSNEAKRPKDREEDRPYPLHRHQCPDCHGFYCSSCKSTIPPSFRPFWDENQKPEIIQYYKSLQQQAEKNKRHRKDCTHCNEHE